MLRLRRGSGSTAAASSSKGAAPQRRSRYRCCEPGHQRPRQAARHDRRRLVRRRAARPRQRAEQPSGSDENGGHESAPWPQPAIECDDRAPWWPCRRATGPRRSSCGSRRQSDCVGDRRRHRDVRPGPSVTPAANASALTGAPSIVAEAALLAAEPTWNTPAGRPEETSRSSASVTCGGRSAAWPARRVGGRQVVEPDRETTRSTGNRGSSPPNTAARRQRQSARTSQRAAPARSPDTAAPAR